LRVFAVHRLPKEKFMAVRVVALLIPLAITLPQLRMSRPEAPAVQSVAATAPTAEVPASFYENRRVSDAAMTRVAFDLPAQESLRAFDNLAMATADDAVAASAMPQSQKASPRRAAPKLNRTASQVKATRTAAKPNSQATRRADRLQADAGCLPSLPCAPVVVAKVTPVVRRPL
jgi:hypothetical protein